MLENCVHLNATFQGLFCYCFQNWTLPVDVYWLILCLCCVYCTVSTAGNLSSQYRWPCLWHSYGYTHVWTIVLDCLYRNTGYLYQEFYKLWCICHGCLFMNTDYGLTMLVSGRLLLYACQYLINVLMCSMTYQQLMTNNNTD